MEISYHGFMGYPGLNINTFYDILNSDYYDGLNCQRNVFISHFNGPFYVQALLRAIHIFQLERKCVSINEHFLDAVCLANPIELTTARRASMSL